ncbi:GMC family oxidoreductase [Phanerochaete sordida]|uniref:GMC family oxidoreductase n=1 Tax=Phanerochaete sordida TaxID=48140 RepID=A0A9P3G1W2_9APHY|nr:GMC family oxidoreductase [Phanerochaete sordida]
MSAKLEDVADKSFDYVIIGGGTAGLVVAARLSEDPSVTVCVLEAGGANLDDPEILTPSLSRGHFGREQYSWNFTTTKQKMCSDKAFPWARGRGLGGSSAMNFLVWTKPPADEIDDWERLGNPGWNWKNYQKYVHKAERFAEPAAELKAKYKMPLYEGDVGREGALAVSYPRTISDLDRCLIETINNAGIPTAPRPYGGDPNGVYWTINTMDQATATRSYASTAYYLPHRTRPNLTVLPHALGTRLLSAPDAAGLLRAHAVEFLFGASATRHTVRVRREALLAAGALQSPQLLELSGIGAPAVLARARVPLRLALPGVGANLQEHVYGAFSWELKPAHAALPGLYALAHPASRAHHAALYAAPPAARGGAYTMGLTNFAFAPLARVAGRARAREIHACAQAHVGALAAAGQLDDGLRAQYAIQLKRLDPDARAPGPVCEVVGVSGVGALRVAPGTAYVSVSWAANSLLSRGTVHITSDDPRQPPELDPHYFEHDADLDVVLETAKFARSLAQHAPLRDMVARELLPGPDVAGDAALAEFIKRSYSTTWHTCGTCAMLPLSAGGVVDAALRVHGAANVRVVDLSVAPLHFSAHAQATVYAIAEQAADIIKGVFVP